MCSSDLSNGAWGCGTWVASQATGGCCGPRPRITLSSLSFLYNAGRLRVPALALALLLSHLAIGVPTVGSETRWRWRARATGSVIITQGDPGRLMRGDYEPIDLFFVVYHRPWETSLRRMIDGLAGVVDIQVLYPDAGRAARRFQRQVKRPCVDPRYMTVDTPWIRDYGPFQATDGGELLWLDYGYAVDRMADDAVPAQLAHDHGALLSFEEPALDGGAVISNGRGLCIMTETSLAEAEVQDRAARRRFASSLGCRGLAVVPALPQETTGHIDVVGQFLDARTLAFAEMTDAEGELLETALEIVRDTAAALGQPLRLVRVPMVSNGDVFYSYVNGTRVGDRFLIPSYSAIDSAAQARAYEILGQAMPGVQLLAIDADEMVTLGGAIHCITLGLKLPSGAHRCSAI